jgi:type II secretory pathway component GspD/PulD (secretin)
MRTFFVLMACALLSPVILGQDKGPNPAGLTGSLELKTYAVPAGQAKALAALLRAIYKPTSSLRIEAVGEASIMVYTGSVDQLQIALVLAVKTGRTTAEVARPKRHQEVSLAYARAEQSLRVSQLLTAHQAKKARKNPGDSRSGSTDLPVNITVFGNKLIVNSEDPEALALIHKLARMLAQTQAGEEDFQFVRLKYANALQAAEELDEMFNGRQAGPPQNAGRVGLDGSKNAARLPMSEPRPERIRVVPDPMTGVLLIKASPLDMLAIQDLLSKTIDTVDNDPSAVTQTWTIGLRHASAQVMSRILHDVFGEFLSTNSVVTTVSGVAGAGIMGTRARGISGGPLSMGVEDQTNTLVLHCSKEVYEQINQLVTQLDKAAADSSHAVKVVSIKGVDPQLVQQAIDAMQGRRSMPGIQNGSSPSQYAARAGR